MDNDSDDDASDNDEEEGANSGLIDAVRADKGDFFGYIDETGNVVYINMNDEGEGEEGGMEVTDGAAMTAGNVFALLHCVYAFSVSRTAVSSLYVVYICWRKALLTTGAAMLTLMFFSCELTIRKHLLFIACS